MRQPTESGRTGSSGLDLSMTSKGMLHRDLSLIGVSREDSLSTLFLRRDAGVLRGLNRQAILAVRIGAAGTMTSTSPVATS